MSTIRSAFAKTVGDLMTPRPITFTGGVASRDAAGVLRDRRIRHAPIVDDEGRYLGIVSLDALLAAPAAPVELAMIHVTPVDVSACAGALARFMYRSKTAAVPVLERGRLVGIVTEADFVRARARLAVAEGCDHEGLHPSEEEKNTCACSTKKKPASRTAEATPARGRGLFGALRSARLFERVR